MKDYIIGTAVAFAVGLFLGVTAVIWVDRWIDSGPHRKPTDYQLLNDASDCVQELVENRGFTNVTIYPGGFLAYHKEGYITAGGMVGNSVQVGNLAPGNKGNWQEATTYVWTNGYYNRLKQ